MAGPAAAPVSDLTLKPLSVHGLCEAVIMIPQAALVATTWYETIWVGIAPDANWTGTSWASSTSAAAWAKILGREAPVVADHDGAILRPVVRDETGDPLRTSTNVFVRVVLGDAGPPAVRPKNDRRHHRRGRRDGVGQR